MTVSYDLDKIRKIIDDLHEVTGLSLGFMDTDHKYIYRRINEEDSFCNMITSCVEGRIRCLCSDQDMSKRCEESMRPISHVCHAGVIDTTVPIIKGGVLSGFIIIGRIRKENSDGVRELISWLGDDVDKVLPHYEKLSFFTEKQLESLIDIISNIIFESSIFIKHNNLADAARDYIERNLHTKLSIDALCSALFTSKNKLYAEFHQTFGTTVNEYVTDRRIEKAKELLMNSDMSVRDISCAVGMDNPPYFCEMFKKRTGTTPKKFRDVPIVK